MESLQTPVAHGSTHFLASRYFSVATDTAAIFTIAGYASASAAAFVSFLLSNCALLSALMTEMLN